MKEWLDSKGTILYSLWMMYLILMFIGLAYPNLCQIHLLSTDNEMFVDMCLA